MVGITWGKDFSSFTHQMPTSASSWSTLVQMTSALIAPFSSLLYAPLENGHNHDIVQHPAPPKQLPFNNGYPVCKSSYLLECSAVLQFSWKRETEEGQQAAVVEQSPQTLFCWANFFSSRVCVHVLVVWLICMLWLVQCKVTSHPHDLAVCAQGVPSKLVQDLWRGGRSCSELLNFLLSVLLQIWALPFGGEVGAVFEHSCGRDATSTPINKLGLSFGAFKAKVPFCKGGHKTFSWSTQSIISFREPASYSSNSKHRL